MIKKIFGILMILALTLSFTLPSTPVFAVDPDPFTDVPSGHWAYQSVMNMARLGIIAGYPDGTFKPDKFVSREEFAKILCGATSLPISNPKTNTFADVTSADWSFRYVETVKDYLTGYPASTGSKPLFKGRQDATREDVAVALVRIKGFDKTTLPNPTILSDMFKDTDSISTNLKNLVAIAVEKGLISGYPDKTIRGSQTITRAEAATLIDKANRIAGDVKDVSYYNSAKLLQLSLVFDKTVGKPGEVVKATVKGIYSNGHTKDVTSEVAWSSSNSSIATVNEDGIIILKKEGAVTITALLDNLSEEEEVVVLPQNSNNSQEIKFIKLTPETTELKVGQILGLKAEAVYDNGRIVDVTRDSRWESSNTDSALVGNDGKVVALKEGTVLLKATYKDTTGYAGLTVSQSVYNPPSTPTVTLQNINLSYVYKEIKKGSKLQIKALGMFSDQSKTDITGSVIWTSSNPSVATISQKGEISAQSEGTAVITATKDGKSSTLYIFVRKK